MTEQEIFDAVVAHLLKQKARAMAPAFEGDMMCAYHGSDGKACAIGCLIPANEYKDWFEGLSVDEIYKSVSTIKDARPLFLEELQRLHDNHEVNTWPEMLVKFAKHWKIQWEHLPQLKNLPNGVA